MEGLIESIIKRQFGDYLTGLNNIDASKSPIKLSNLKLCPDRINQDLEDVAFEITDGVIGQVTLTPSLWGTVTVTASGIKLDVQINMSKAMNMAKNALQGGDNNYYSKDREDLPQQPVPPRYCEHHNTSEKRKKTSEPQSLSCRSCKATYMTSYTEFTLCAVCSERERACMICGISAPVAGNYVPPTGQTRQAVSSVLGGNSLAPPSHSSDMFQNHVGDRMLSKPTPIFEYDEFTGGNDASWQGPPHSRHPQGGRLPPPPPPPMDPFHTMSGWMGPAASPNRSHEMSYGMQVESQPQHFPFQDEHNHLMRQQQQQESMQASHPYGGHDQRRPGQGPQNSQQKPTRTRPIQDDTFVGFIREMFK